MFGASNRPSYVMIAVGIIGTLVSLAAQNIVTTLASILLTVIGAFAVTSK